MIDLRNIAQQLRLPAEQLRIAADLLEQGYQPAFIARYRADEAGHLPNSVLWSLKFAIQREKHLTKARNEAVAHLGEGVELDDEAKERIERARSIVDIDVTMRCFRARRAARQSGERSGQASQLLEKMISASTRIDDMTAWVAEQLAIEPATSEAVVGQCTRLIATLLGGDTRFMERMRQAIQKRAGVRIEALPDAPTVKATPGTPTGELPSDDKTVEQSSEGTSTDVKTPTADDATNQNAEAADHDSDAGDAWGAEDDLVGDHEHADQEHTDHEHTDHDPTEHDHETLEPVAEATSLESGTSDASLVGAATDSTAPDSTAPDSTVIGSEDPPISLTFDSRGKKKGEGKQGKRKERTAAKAPAKLTPRQRRRRWLTSVLLPFRSLKKPLQRLTAYQMLMLGRGQRSQLIKVDLEYDRKALVGIARDVFVGDVHPLAKWFSEACEQALTGGLLSKIEADVLAEEDERAQYHLLESAVDQLRVSLLQRPVKGHRILVVDTVGPNSSCVAIIDSRGKCLAAQEVVCSSQPSVVSQNVIMLGELVHKHRVTLVALSNGPARRFLVHTVAELMKQSSSGNLRWTMVDRGGAEAYAASRQASVELPQLNRRFRAAVWLGRRLQDPLTELLKLDPSRLRLGSYQRELSQEPLKDLVTATLSDCLCVKGVDARYGSEQQFNYVPGVSPAIANRLAELATKREYSSREQLSQNLVEWSETGKRQALAFLRIYNSDQTLDGTLIHPDDYRLAQRLIEGTELPQPPAAPPGWLPPKIKVPKPPKGKLTQPPSTEDTSMASSESNDSNGPADLSGPASEIADARLAGSEAEANTIAQATTKDDAIPEHLPNAETSDEASTQEIASGSETVADSQDDSAVAEDTSAVELDGELRPEYPEQVVAEQAKPPTIDIEKLARGWQVGRSKLSWLAHCLANPFGDTRDQRPPVPMLTHVPTLADLQPGMSVYAIVVGVAEFGAFVELGPDCGGLIHISRLSAGYVEDPHQAVQIGDLVQAWVVSVDVEKKRVALTALSPEQQQEQAEAQREAEQSRQSNEGRGRRSGTGHGSGPGRPQTAGQTPGQHSSQQGSQRGGQQGRGQQGRGQQGRGQQSGGQQGGGQQAGGQQGGGQQGGGQQGGARGTGNAQGRPPQSAGGQSRGGGGRPGGGDRRDRSSDRGQGGGRSRGRDDAPSKPVIVKSKKPSKPITDAMQKGQEPLRSFSDLMQYYELQRPDSPAQNPPVTPPAGSQPSSGAQNAPTPNAPAPHVSSGASMNEAAIAGPTPVRSEQPGSQTENVGGPDQNAEDAGGNT